MRAMGGLRAAVICVALLVGGAGCKSQASGTPDLSQPSGGDDMGDVDAGLPATNPAAAVWTSCGGGSGIGDVSQSQLNVTIGATTVVGDSAASSGADVSFGYFSNDTQ